MHILINQIMASCLILRWSIMFPQSAVTRSIRYGFYKKLNFIWDPHTRAIQIRLGLRRKSFFQHQKII